MPVQGIRTLAQARVCFIPISNTTDVISLRDEFNSRTVSERSSYNASVSIFTTAIGPVAHGACCEWHRKCFSGDELY
jgi:hypothetical protein